MHPNTDVGILHQNQLAPVMGGALKKSGAILPKVNISTSLCYSVSLKFLFTRSFCRNDDEDTAAFPSLLEEKIRSEGVVLPPKKTCTVFSHRNI